MLNALVKSYLRVFLQKMKQRGIIYIVGILSIALLGFSVIQGYWVQNAYLAKQENFTRIVNEAAQKVIVTLEKMEMVKRFQQSNTLADSTTYLNTLDSINRVMLKEMQSINTRKDLEIFFNKYFMTRDLIEDVMIEQGVKPIEKRLNQHLLDSLLRREFESRNMNTPYEYGIFSSSRDLLVMKSPDANEQALINPRTSFHFEIFPDDMYPRPDYLYLNFPYERKFLLNQMWPLLSISIILILIIIISFTYTLIQLFRQRRLSELKTDFINNMTHEFKTPVSTISLACEALSDKDIQKSEELYRNYIGIIREENHRLGQMAERILQSAKSEKGEVALNKETVDIHDIITEVIKNIRIQVEIKDGQIIKDFQAKNSILVVDRMHMTNVIHNLLDNANKYTPIKPQLIVSTRDVKNGVIISVEDNGIGISKVDQKKIFEKLYRVPEGNVHNFKGFGLGLSYVKTIVERHGGFIKLESELKKGTKFEVFIPTNHR